MLIEDRGGMGVVGGQRDDRIAVLALGDIDRRDTALGRLNRHQESSIWVTGRRLLADWGDAEQPLMAP
jgi:hypothetical protein